MFKSITLGNNKNQIFIIFFYEKILLLVGGGYIALSFNCNYDTGNNLEVAMINLTVVEIGKFFSHASFLQNKNCLSAISKLRNTENQYHISLICTPNYTHVILLSAANWKHGMDVICESLLF